MMQDNVKHFYVNTVHLGRLLNNTVFYYTKLDQDRKKELVFVFYSLHVVVFICYVLGIPFEMFVDVN